MRDSWTATFGGSSNSHKVAVLEEGLKYTPISIIPNEAQFLETRKFQIDVPEIFENVAYIMAYHADHSIPDNIDDWLDQFEMLSIYEVLPEIGVSIADLNLLTIGLVMDMWTEKINDGVKYDRVAGQAEFDSF